MRFFIMLIMFFLLSKVSLAACIESDEKIKAVNYYSFYSYQELAQGNDIKITDMQPVLFLWSGSEECNIDSLGDAPDHCYDHEVISDDNFLSLSKSILHERSPVFYTLLWPDFLYNKDGKKYFIKAYLGSKGADFGYSMTINLEGGSNLLESSSGTGCTINLLND